MADPRVLNHRRYCFLKYRHYHELDDDLEYLWDGKRKTIPGTDISDVFPGAIELRAAGYEAIEEVQGADEDELTEVGLSNQTIQAVFAAIATIG